MAKQRATLQGFTKPLATPAKGAIEAQLAREAGPSRPHYPKVSVYLTAEEVKALRMLYVETGRKVSDICAEAVREYMARNGHARGTTFKA
jgi:hypothetical protein